jgi:dCMP deaminase
MSMDWDTYFMNIAHCVKLRSKDPRKQVGAVLVSCKNNRIVSTGYNSVQSGLDDQTIDWNNREYIKNIVIHAEANALLYSESKYENTILYTTLSPCVECLKLLSASGIKKIIYDEKHKSFEKTQELCEFFSIEIQNIG